MANKKITLLDEILTEQDLLCIKDCVTAAEISPMHHHKCIETVNKLIESKNKAIKVSDLFDDQISGYKIYQLINKHLRILAKSDEKKSYRLSGRQYIVQWHNVELRFYKAILPL